jgi:hypothetical protein
MNYQNILPADIWLGATKIVSLAWRLLPKGFSLFA